VKTLPIGDCQLPIGTDAKFTEDLSAFALNKIGDRQRQSAIGNWQSAIGNKIRSNKCQN
jgi:hypothetical protein